MTINLAVYTAQEGYSWQPGSAIPVADLRSYKASIGKFPSADDPNLPFGGVFLKDGQVVFYRYHVGRKIDFCGRDALYCVLGAVPLADAAKVNPRTLFALPQFAGPMRPFPTSAEVPEAVGDEVPEWLRDLDGMSLDVRISGTVEDMKCEVARQVIPPAAPSPEPGTAPVSVPEPFQTEPSRPEPSPCRPEPAKVPRRVDASASRKGESSVTTRDVPFLLSSRNRRKGRAPWRRFLPVVLAGMVVALALAALFFVVSLITGCPADGGRKLPAKTPADEVGETPTPSKRGPSEVGEAPVEDVKRDAVERDGRKGHE